MEMNGMGGRGRVLRRGGWFLPRVVWPLAHASSLVKNGGTSDSTPVGFVDIRFRFFRHPRIKSFGSGRGDGGGQ